MTKPYATSDLPLAAFFVCNGRELIGTVPEDGKGRHSFLFEDWPERDKLINDWLSGRGDASLCKRFFKAQQTCKYALPKREA